MTVVYIEEFQKVALPKCLTTLDESSTPGNDSFEFKVRDITRRNTSLASTRVLSEMEISQVNQKFLEDINQVYEDALQKHVS